MLEGQTNIFEMLYPTYEDNVDDKYYLSEKLLNCFMSEGTGKYPRKERFLQNMNRPNQDIANSITTLNGSRPTDTFIKIKNNTKKEYLEAKDGDGIDISSRMEYHRGTVQKGKTQTLTTMGGENNGVIVCVKGIATNESEEWQKPPLEEKSRTLLANKSNAGVGCIDTNLRIRKLTPRECGHLMGVKDEDINKIIKNQSDSSAYHLFGDSIVVNVLMAIFKEMI